MKSAGFTLLELLITMVIGAILITLALPGFQDTVKRNGVLSDVADLRSGLNMARSEAVGRAGNVSICASSSPHTTCGTNWSNGWLVFVDEDSDGAVDAGSDTILRKKEDLVDGNVLTAVLSGGAAFNGLTFDAEGRVSLANNGTFKVCENTKNTKFTRGLWIMQSGRVQSSVDSDSPEDGVHDDVSGTNFGC